jgi:hypothetical protein
LEIRADNHEVSKIKTTTMKYSSHALGKRVEAKVDIQLTYYDNQPFVSEITARLQHQGIEYENSLDILLQKFDEFSIEKDVYWAINTYDIYPYVQYDPQKWLQYDISPDPDINIILSDLGFGNEALYPSDRWWNPANSEENSRELVATLINDLR